MKPTGIFRILAFICASWIASGFAHGTSIIFPTYSTPIMVKDMILATSPDRTRLIGMTNEGKQKWARELSKKGAAYLHRSGEVMLISGASVYWVNPESGEPRSCFEAKLGLENLQYLVSADLFFGCLESKGVSSIFVYDGTSHKMLLSETRGESVAYADAGLIVIAKGIRNYSGGGYSYGKCWLEGFDRNTGKRTWTVDFKQQPWPHNSVCRVDGHIVCEDGPDLVVIPVTGGDVRRKPADKPKDAIGPSGLRSENGLLVYVTSEMNHNDFNRSKQTVYRISVPDLKTMETKSVEVIEAARAETAGDFLITDSLYRTACFRRDGGKVWEHFQMHRTGVVDGFIHFSDYENGVARIGSIEVSSGKERILLSEDVDLKK